MNIRILLGALAATVLIACSQKNPAPEALALEEVPEAIRGAFANAEESLKEQAEQTATSVSENKLAAASMQLKMLSSIRELDQKQREVVTRSMYAVNDQLQLLVESAQAQAASQTGAAPGAPPAPTSRETAEAAAVLQHYQATK